MRPTSSILLSIDPYLTSFFCPQASSPSTTGVHPHPEAQKKRIAKTGWFQSWLRLTLSGLQEWLDFIKQYSKKLPLYTQTIAMATAMKTS
jgi:hypothetical protein